MLKASDLKLRGRYNFKYQPERLIYIGRKLYRDGPWYQFELVDKPYVVWAELREHDLDLIEETPGNYVCPTSKQKDIPEEDQIIGCGLPFKGVPDYEGFVDCPNCGVFFKPERETQPQTKEK